MLTPEEIQKNYESFVNYIFKFEENNERKITIQKFLDYFEERLALCPASLKKTFHGAYPGGLVSHSLNVMKNCYKLFQVYPDFKVNKSELFFVCLFHDIGKLGDLTEERYVPQSSDWHARQGNVYEYNAKMKFMPVPQMSLYLLQSFGIKMSYDEYVSILIHDGPNLEENRQYCMKEPALALLLHQADRIACEQEKISELSK